jgi:hypothetical protein
MHMQFESGAITNAVIAYGMSGPTTRSPWRKRASPAVVRDYLMIVIVVPLLSPSGSLLLAGA